MKINLTGDISEIKEGVIQLSDELDIELSQHGINLYVEKTDSGFSAENNEIKYNKPCEFFRAFAFWTDAMRNKKDICMRETPSFEVAGSMADMSRNAVYTVKSVKKMLRLHALMGLNMMMLYTEDTIELDGEPYFGYMRGAYSPWGLTELDRYAANFGIELIPCIQTLGHLSQLLKWKTYSDMQDVPSVILADFERTYEFIEKLIKTCSETFKSRKIHIGMDEVYGVGTGRYKELFGEKDAVKIILNHLNRVVKIAKRYNMEPMMWSDMFCSQCSETHNIWDTEMKIPQWVIDEKNPECDLVFWCYHIINQDDYEKLIDIHNRFGGRLWFAGGVETYFGFAPRMALSTSCINASLSACKKKGVKNVFCTLWGDDGAEVDYFSALLGLQMYAEHCYRKEFDEKELLESFRVCTGCSGRGFLDCGLFDDVPGKDTWDVDMSNISRCLFWQDPLLGVFDKSTEDVDLETHYKLLAEKMADAADKNTEYSDIFTQYMLSAKVLAVKASLGKRMRSAYKENNRAELQKIADNDLLGLKEMCREIHKIRKKLWYSHCKPFGFEILDIRYSGLCGRIETAIERIHAYVSNEIPKLEELETERLPYKRAGIEWGEKYGRCPKYDYMISVMQL